MKQMDNEVIKIDDYFELDEDIEIYTELENIKFISLIIIKTSKAMNPTSPLHMRMTCTNGQLQTNGFHG